jgi:hypothetical protein
MRDLNTARIISLILGAWLFISAFIWPHSASQLNNTWILGALVVVFTIVSMKVPEVRYLNAVVAVWLFISVWALPTYELGTQWNNALCAIAIFFVSLAPGYLGGPGEKPLSRL